ncbi:PREDICTED: uncharacterized protein K02A2.6-like [Trachymyrmex septentrionalis]|uniref:uncharacterized protein K02A2.6-like n=1 Tax=Trachymyrmex septentrionalis TaxID=34720 RepID=UPI00084F02E7|nr:PREDICTED: uncharacterized protein K02A2.6-like [Trachymyrmex septentrionalis]
MDCDERTGWFRATAKRLITAAVFEDDAIVTEHRAMRLLSRRYDLTNMGYKFLEIGINVGPSSYVEIALGDHRGHELSLSLETWKNLYEQRWNIYKMLRIQGQFYKLWTANRQSLHAERCYAHHAQNVNPSSSTTINVYNQLNTRIEKYVFTSDDESKPFPKWLLWYEYTLVKESESLPEEMRTRLLLDNLGQPEFDRLVDHVAPADPTKMKQTDLIAILKNLFRDKTSLPRRRIEILNYRYDKAIPISEHIDQINRLASDFERSKFTDDNFRVLLLLQSLYFSSDNEDLKKRALCVIEKNENATLSDITTELEAHMNVSTNLKTLENPSNFSTSTTQSVRFKSEKKKRPSSESTKQSGTTESVPRQSSNCNGWAHRRANCPFRDATCFKCSLKGHIAKVCRSKDKVDYLSTDNTIDNTVDIDKPAIQSITSLNNYRRIYIPTGSDVTTIGKDTWIRLGSPTLSSGKSVEHAGGNALKTLGRFKCKIRAANREGDVVIDVAARDGLNLFGLNAIEKLNL